MYQIPSEEYEAYYKDYIDRDIREFECKCVIGGSLTPESEIASINIEHDLLSGAEEYTIGNLAAAKLIITVSSNVVVREGDKIDLTIILKTKEVDREGNPINIPIPMGKFYVFNIKSTKLSKTIEAYDSLYKSELEKLYQSRWKYTTTEAISVHTILDELCAILDIGYSTNIPNEVIYRPVYVPEIALNDEGKYVEIESSSNQVCFGMNVGQALSYIAAYLKGNFIVDGDGQLKLIRIYNRTVAEKSYTANKYTTPSCGEAIYRIDTVHCTFSTGEVITMGESSNASLSFENPFYDKDRLEELFEYIKEIRYKPIKTRVKGDLTLQLGDCIELIPHNSGESIMFPVLRMNFSFTGGCSIDVESVCKAEAEKNINYKGTLTSRVDKLEGNISKISEIIDRLSESLRTLSNVKENIDDMDELIDSLPTVIFPSDLELFNSLLNQIKKNDAKFNEEYEAVVNNRYLK